uniref:Uncharacterized protein n=1 Tax=Anguilla anguilla TaxID=7936 RepID=A0A0E9XTR0_ANGAN
MATYSYLKF